MYEKCYRPSLKLGVLHFYVNLTQNLISPPCVFNTGFISCPDKNTTRERIKEKEFCTRWNLVINLVGNTGLCRKAGCSLCAIYTVMLKCVQRQNLIVSPLDRFNLFLSWWSLPLGLKVMDIRKLDFFSEQEWRGNLRTRMPAPMTFNTLQRDLCLLFVLDGTWKLNLG